MYKDYLKIAFRNIAARRLRSWLTVLGIVIGVFLIVALLSLSEGLKATINKQLKSLGGEIIFVMPGDESNPFMGMMMGGEKLEKADILAIERARGVETVVPFAYRGIVARYKGKGENVFLSGQSWKEGLEVLERYQGWNLSEGRWPVPGKKEVLVGHQVANGTFNQKVEINSEIAFKGRKFEVVGVLKSLGSQTDDSFVYLDMSFFYEITGEEKGTAHYAMAKIEEGASLEQTAQNIKENLEKTRKRRPGLEGSDFAVITSDNLSGIAGNILGIVQLAIVAFAGIAILVGGIGITNTMFTAVRERTKEIGIMKAIGAKNSAILTIFLMEAGMIGAAGGIGGTILGAVLAEAINIYAKAHPGFYFSASLSLGLIVFGLGFSFVIGSLAGFIPAQRAAKLKPVEALRRYE